MRIRGMGVNLQPNGMVGRMDVLRTKLDTLIGLGMDTVEIPVQGMRAITHGVIDEDVLKAYAHVLAEYPLKITTHAPYEMNLFSPSMEDERQLLLSSIQASIAIGARTMVYHVGRFVPEELFLYPHLWPKWTDSERDSLLAMERTILREAGDMARSHDLRIGMENMRPYLDSSDYCYSVLPSRLASQVQAIDHPNVGITLDVGHLNLSVRMFALDLQSELEAISPHVVHLHVHDNFGQPCLSVEKNQYALLPKGRGDMHMPIGGGNVPMGTILKALGQTFDGYAIHELRDFYEASWPSLRVGLETIVDEAGLADEVMW